VKLVDVAVVKLVDVTVVAAVLAEQLAGASAGPIRRSRSRDDEHRPPVTVPSPPNATN
jgi:hypothetical protein